MHNDELNLNIEFIRASEDPTSAADVIAESLMQEYGSDKDGFWIHANKELLSLILYFVAESSSIADEDRTFAKCVEVTENIDSFPGEVLREATEQGDEFLKLKLRHFSSQKEKDDIAFYVGQLLKRAQK